MDADQIQTKAAEDPSHRRWWPFRAKAPPDPSIAAVMAQWAEYELIFNDILQRLNAQLARAAKYEKKALERRTAEEPTNGEVPHAPVALPTNKQALRSAYAASRYGGRIQSLLNSKEAEK